MLIYNFLMNSQKLTRVCLSLAEKVVLELVKQGKNEKVCLLYGVASSALIAIIKTNQKKRF